MGLPLCCIAAIQGLPHGLPHGLPLCFTVLYLCFTIPDTP